MRILGILILTLAFFSIAAVDSNGATNCGIETEHSVGFPKNEKIPTTCISRHSQIEDIPSALGEPFVMVVEDAVDLTFTTAQIENHFGNKHFTLIVKGVCAGKCSRLLLPLAKGVVLEKDSFVAFSDSSLMNLTAFSATSSFDQSNTTPSQKVSSVNINELVEEYQFAMANDYVQDVMLLSSTKADVGHLTFHSFVQRQLFHKKPTRCIARKLIVILTPEYFSNGFVYARKFDLPDNDTIIEISRQKFGDEIVVTKTYEINPIYGCP